MKVFAYRNIKSEIMKSSSGGAFIRICQEFEMLHGKGNVAFYGASMLEDMSVDTLEFMVLNNAIYFKVQNM